MRVPVKEWYFAAEVYGGKLCGEGSGVQKECPTNWTNIKFTVGGAVDEDR
jgi:hypothetical protein